MARGYSSLQRAHQLRVRARHGDAADAARGRRDEQTAERRIHNRVTDLLSEPAAAVRRRRHPQLRHGALVEPAARSVAGVQHRAGDLGALTQMPLDGLQAARLGVLPRRDADDPLEVPLKVIRAAAEARRQRASDGCPSTLAR